jgi:hypothetical protein
MPDAPLSPGAYGAAVARLHEFLRQQGVGLPASEVDRAFFGPLTRQEVQQYQRNNGLPPTGELDANTARLINIVGQNPVPGAPTTSGDVLPAGTASSTGIVPTPGGATFTVNGSVASNSRAGIAGLRVQIVDKNVGADVPLAETATGATGKYRASFESARSLKLGKTKPDLQARVYAGDALLASSEVLYDATSPATLNVLLPDSAAGLPSEYETLVDAISANYKGLLGDLQESTDRRDITYLANKTGWDARAVALAALADQHSRGTTAANPPGGAAKTVGSSIHPAFFYALFRAGFPANPDTLYQANPDAVAGVWQQAIAQGVIPSTLANQITGAAKAFQSLSAAKSLTAQPSIGLSPLKDLLQLSLGNDPQRQEQFASLYTQYQNDLPTFWSTLQKSFGAAATQRLQLDGQLSYLTLNNAPLIAQLHQAESKSPMASPIDLARRGYYQAGKWLPLLNSGIPAEIPGATPDEQRANYAELLATHVRLAFPTAVVAGMVASGAVPMTSSAGLATSVSQFLTDHQGKFEIGTEPIEAYLARNKLTGTVAAPVVTQIKRLQRVYQITPNDQAFTALLQNNLDSAFAITRYDAAGFIRTFGDAMGGATIAEQTYAKARQVCGAVVNIATSFLSAHVSPAMGSNVENFILNPKPQLLNNPSPHVFPAMGSHVRKFTHNPKPQPPNNPSYPIVAYPTLEGLLGSMDFCACDECRSIMSPAAYMVNLLEYIDCKTPQSGFQNPQAVLFGRRPDLQYLPLTCENTNVALPYIDLVNETMEYFVANQLSLANYQGHDTGSTISSDELMASPQYVNNTAYTTLQTAWFPPPLPFHRPLALLRLHFQKFGVPLQDAMAALRTSDAIERGSATGFGWRDILMEQLGLSRAEYRILTDSKLKLQDLYGYPSLSDSAVISNLSGLQDFSRRTGVSYEDIFTILRTRFINPNCVLIPRLQRLNVPITTLQSLKNGSMTAADFKNLLPAALDAREYGGSSPTDLDAVVKWVTDAANYGRIMGLITIADPTGASDLCSGASLQFRYANPDNTANMLHAIDFVRLIRFIRLWRKLGLTIEQTDNITAALYPAADLPTGTNDAQDLQLQDAGFGVLLPRIGFLFQVLNQLQLTADRNLASLLACWAPIGTSGDHSLYAAMFLTTTVLQNDLAFADDGYGNLLQDNSQTLLDPKHVAALRAAFNLTGAEFAFIVATLGFNTSTILTLAKVSAIYRIGWLARTLQISVVEFLLLTRFTGLDPFAPPDPSPTAPAEPPVIRLIRLVQAAKAASLQPVQIVYLMWNQDISGLSAPPDASITGLASTLRADFAAVESQFTLVDDPSGSIAKSLMELVYGATATDFFLGLLNNTLTTWVAYGNPQPTLAQPILDAASGRLSYDDLRKQLTFASVFDAATLAAVQAAITANGNYAPLQTAVSALFAANHKAVDPFFNAYGELGPGPGTPYGIYVASSDPPETKRSALLANLLVDLKSRRKQEQALEAIAAAAGTDPSFGPALLTDAAAMNAASGAGAAIADLTAMEVQGLSAQFFLANNPAVPPDQTIDAVPVIDYAAGGSNPLPPGQGGGPIAAIWSGFLAPPQDGAYNIQISTDPAAAVTLSVGGVAITLGQAAGVWSNQTEISLVAGMLTPIVLSITTVKNNATLSWESKGIGWQIIPGASFYSDTAVARLRATHVRFLKAVSLATNLSLSANETAWLARNADLVVNGKGWLNALTDSGNPDPGTSAGLRDVLSALLDFARLKRALSPKDERLLAVLQNPARTAPNGTSALLTLTGWSADSRDALLQQFFGNTQLVNLAHVENFRRVYDAYAVIKACGIAAAALIPATINDPTADRVTSLQSALRALYAEADWLAVIKPINNTMRDLQRDALVAYILQQMGDQLATADVNTPDKLFEYFLMDVQMEPCMQTSRIRHALSSIQLFIERCLRNLESSVSASDIAASRWEVMKRFRLWQANLEVFLWPERWLYPELRDDQSPFFQQTMTQLLQTDMSDDAAATAYLNYLTQLEAVAKLEPCGIYYSPADPTKAPGEADEFAHVIARTAGRKYYYRSLTGGNWTPWVETKLDIEDTPLAPFVWNDRLLLFWLKILKQSPVTPPAPDPGPPADVNNPSVAQLTPKQLTAGVLTNAGPQMKVNVQAILCWSEFYNGKWQPTKMSDVNHPTFIGSFDADGSGAFHRKNFRLQVASPSYSPDKLVVSIDLCGNPLISDPPGFLLYNTHSAPPALEDAADRPNLTAIGWRDIATSYGSSGPVDPNVSYPPSSSPNTFWIFYIKMQAQKTGKGWGPVTAYSNDILTSPVGERVVVPQPFSEMATAWNMPFFFEDSRNVFYVTTSQARVPLHLYQGFGSYPGLTIHSAAGDIPTLVVPPAPGPVAHFTPIVSPANPPLANPGEMRRFVTEDAYIRAGIATTTPVSYQDVQIGPRGS